jgi:hypothetical protein
MTRAPNRARPRRTTTAGPPAPPLAGDSGFKDFVGAWNAGQGLPTPDLHARMADWLEEGWRSGARRLLLTAFRGAGKSTLVGLFAAWLLARDPDLRLVVVAAELRLARKMVRNVKRIIERFEPLRPLKPGERDQWAADQFTVVRARELRDPSMLARGIDANITGSRADVVICDDVEVPKTAATEGRRADLRDKLGEIDYVLTPGGTQLYIGTPHSYFSIYARAARTEIGEDKPFLDGFARLELPVYDAEGRSAWPERFPPEEIEQRRRRTGAAKFASQMLLTPVASRACRLDPERLVPYRGEIVYREGNGVATLEIEGTRMVAGQCWWDPARGRREKADRSAVVAVFFDATGRVWLHAVAYLPAGDDEDDATGPDAIERQCHAALDFAEANHAPSLSVETNGIGGFLPSTLRRLARTRRLPFAIVERTNTRNKEARILDALDALLESRRLHAHERVFATPFVAEMREWRPYRNGRARRDDALDALAGAILAQPTAFSPLPKDAPAADAEERRQRHRGWAGGGRLHQAKTGFKT